MMKTRLILCCAALALAFTPPSKVALTFNLQKGKTYIQNTSTTSVSKQTVQGNAIVTESTASAKIYMELKEEKPEANSYSIWYGDIAMSVSQMGQSMKFTSDTSSLSKVDPQSKVLAAITGEKFSATINKKGLVQEVMGLEELISSITSEMGGANSPMSDQISESLGDDGFAKNIETTTNIFPDGEVKKGDSWTIEQTTSTGFPLLAKNTYTLEAINKGIATVNVVGVMEIDPANSTMNIQGMEATLFMEGERTGKLQVEIASGWVISGTLADEVAGSISVAPSAQLPEGMTIPIETTYSTTISSTE